MFSRSFQAFVPEYICLTSSRHGTRYFGNCRYPSTFPQKQSHRTASELLIMISEEPAAETQPSPKDAALAVPIQVVAMEKSASESSDPKSNAQPPQFQLPDLRDDPEKSDMFLKATLKLLHHMLFPYHDHTIRALSPILDEYLNIWSEICVDKSDICRSKMENLIRLDLNLMTALVAVREKRDELWLEFNGHEGDEGDEEIPDAREVYCPNCDESSEEDGSDDLCHCPIHPNTGTEYLACGITTNPWKQSPADEDKDSANTTVACSAHGMATPNIPGDKNDCTCPCATCCASRGLDSDDDSYFLPSSELESEDEIPCQC